MKLNVEEIRKYEEDKINKNIDEMEQPTLSREQKRLIVLDEMNSSKTDTDEISFPNNTFTLFDVRKVRDFIEKNIEEKIKNIKDDKLTEKQKRLIVLEEMNTSFSDSEIEEEVESKISKEKKEIKKENIDSTIKDSSMISRGISEMESSTAMESISTMCSTGISEFSNEKRNYWIKYKLYDAKVSTNLKGLIMHSLEEEKGKEKYCYFYNNKLTTYYYIQSVQFGKDYSINESLETDKNYNSSLGLFFCGKKIELRNEEAKTCHPNEMICKECMEKDKKRYNLNTNHLVNINGRAAKKNKNAFHCFGHFIVGNQIENCLKNFSCEACKLLDKYEQYYFLS